MALIAKGVLSQRIQNVRKAKEAFRDDVQDVLVSCAYQATRGNTNYANELLEAVRDTVHIKPLTMWLETFAPLVVRQDKFVLNKGMAKTMHVTDEASFAEYEKEMRKSKWWEMVPPQKAKSMFDAVDYCNDALERMAKKLNDNGQPDLAAVMRGFINELTTSGAYKMAVEVKMAREQAESALI